MSTTPPSISESPILAEHVDLVHKVANDAATFLGVDPNSAPPETVVERVDDFVYRLQKGEVAAPEGEDVEVYFGCLWGQQLVRELGWQWANVTFHDHGDSQAMGVFSPDRSLAIYPFHFITGCLENGAPVTIMLAFNTLRDGESVPALPPQAYENVMDNVHHIVPRD
ncbi:hypothetical protein NHH03_04000 [Stieleria sp. TO1_6]|uniref:hypothetical protein n=1 Tax=Stieleria tagensis TaxID=2956795 RepID=UPI00209AB76D|nr:hypothetical protein [Stieleria tagensis]MCO8120888.1 hypothetical protein [Stieleria tagensis]